MEPIDLTVKNRTSEEEPCASKSKSNVLCDNYFEPIDLSMPTLLASEQGSKIVHNASIVKEKPTEVKPTDVNGLITSGNQLNLICDSTISSISEDKPTTADKTLEPHFDRSLSDFSSPDLKYQYTLGSFHSTSDEKESPCKTGHSESCLNISGGCSHKQSSENEMPQNVSVLSESSLSYEYMILPSDTSGSTEKSGNESFAENLKSKQENVQKSGTESFTESMKNIESDISVGVQEGLTIAGDNISSEPAVKQAVSCDNNSKPEDDDGSKITGESKKKSPAVDDQSSDEKENDSVKNQDSDVSINCASENMDHASGDHFEAGANNNILREYTNEIFYDSIVEKSNGKDVYDLHGKRKAECLGNFPGSNCRSEDNDAYVKRMKYDFDYSEPIDEEENETFLINCSGDADIYDDNVIKEIDETDIDQYYDNESMSNDMSVKALETNKEESDDDFPFTSLITTKIPCDRVIECTSLVVAYLNDTGNIMNIESTAKEEEVVENKDNESVDSGDTDTYSPDVTMMTMMTESTASNNNNGETSEQEQAPSFDPEINEKIFDMVFAGKFEINESKEENDEQSEVKKEKSKIKMKIKSTCDKEGTSAKYTTVKKLGKGTTKPSAAIGEESNIRLSDIESSVQNGQSKTSSSQTKVRRTLIKYTCSLCEERFASARTYSAHMRNVHDGIALMKCDFCEEEFAHHRSLQKHMKTHPEVKIRYCPECKKAYDSASALTRHMLTHTGERPHQCTICDKRYMDAGTLTRHMVIHSSEKPFPCTICDKVFNRQSRLNTHMQMHNGETPHKCPICEKVFTESGNLKQHMMLHTGERPYKCDLCGKGFTKGASLRTHMLSHGDDKPHHCPVCGKSFANEGDMYNHIVLHNTEKAYKCQTCDKAFTHNSRLQRHIKTHTGEKPFFCTECGKGFAEAGHMRRHMLVHTGVKPFKCDICGKAFTQAGNLRAHMLIHSKDEKSEGMLDSADSQSDPATTETLTPCLS